MLKVYHCTRLFVKVAVQQPQRGGHWQGCSSTAGQESLGAENTRAYALEKLSDADCIQQPVLRLVDPNGLLKLTSFQLVFLQTTLGLSSSVIMANIEASV